MAPIQSKKRKVIEGRAEPIQRGTVTDFARCYELSRSSSHNEKLLFSYG